jgi:acyl-CoA thioester hydrolase
MTERPPSGSDWPDLAGRIEGTGHVLPVRVYYEDTDFSGAVYHAGYLRFCERGRSDFLRLIGIGHRELAAGEVGGRRLGFVVRRLVADYLKAAGIDDLLEVRTRFERATGVRFDLLQEVHKGEETVFRQTVTVALVDDAGRPVRLPGDMIGRIAPYLDGGA